MGLMVSTLANMPYADRRLYIYLLDYGWPEGPFEKLFKDNFQELARRASETYSVVVMGNKGVHFANEVFSWHNINGFDGDDVLPAILITEAHPSYFKEKGDDGGKVEMDRMALISLKKACTNPAEFLQIASSIFEDLSNGLSLRNFRVAQKDELTPSDSNISGPGRIGRRITKSLILQPNFAGFGVDLKQLFAPSSSRK